MDEQIIIPREMMRARGRDARAAGKGRDDHNMNWNASAIVEWQAGWDELDTRKPDYADSVLAMRLVGTLAAIRLAGVLA